MTDVPIISVDDAKDKLDEGDTLFIDIRDVDSYNAGHIPGALHLTNESVQDFMAKTERGQSMVVYCYHGNTSLGGATFFLEQGFTDVASMTGGFESWRLSYDYDLPDA